MERCTDTSVESLEGRCFAVESLEGGRFAVPVAWTGRALRRWWLENSVQNLSKAQLKPRSKLVLLWACKVLVKQML